MPVPSVRPVRSRAGALVTSGFQRSRRCRNHGGRALALALVPTWSRFMAAGSPSPAARAPDDVHRRLPWAGRTAAERIAESRRPRRPSSTRVPCCPRRWDGWRPVPRPAAGAPAVRTARLLVADDNPDSAVTNIGRLLRDRADGRPRGTTVFKRWRWPGTCSPIWSITDVMMAEPRRLRPAAAAARGSPDAPCRSSSSRRRPATRPASRPGRGG